MSSRLDPPPYGPGSSVPSSLSPTGRSSLIPDLGVRNTLGPLIFRSLRKTTCELCLFKIFRPFREPSPSTPLSPSPVTFSLHPRQLLLSLPTDHSLLSGTRFIARVSDLARRPPDRYFSTSRLLNTGASLSLRLGPSSNA